MKFLICSKVNKAELKKTLLRHGFKVVTKNPDIILCYGGDGTILYAERKYPSIPKLAVKKTKICHRCELKSNGLDEPLEKIKIHNYTTIKEMKLEANYKNKRLLALNEIQVHSKLPTKTVRFSLYVGNQKFENLIGDGVIVATPFGSTAYYQSTGGKQFEMGIGISFNNLYMKKIDSFVVPDSSEVRVVIDRGPALLVADNDEKFIELNAGDVITVKKSDEKAQFIKLY